MREYIILEGIFFLLSSSICKLQNSQRLWLLVPALLSSCSFLLASALRSLLLHSAKTLHPSSSTKEKYAHGGIEPPELTHEAGIPIITMAFSKASSWFVNAFTKAKLCHSACSKTSQLTPSSQPAPPQLPPYVAPRCRGCPLLQERLSQEASTPAQKKVGFSKMAALGGTAIAGASLLITPAPRGSLAHLAALKAENRLLEERRRLRGN